MRTHTHLTNMFHIRECVIYLSNVYIRIQIEHVRHINMCKIMFKSYLKGALSDLFISYLSAIY